MKQRLRTIALVLTCWSYARTKPPTNRLFLREPLDIDRLWRC